MNKGFFLIHRKLWDKQWFQDLDFEQKIILIEILRCANWETNKLRDGTIVKPGQLAISLRKFAPKIKTTIQRLRTLLTICSKVGFATHDTTRGFTVITIVNWDTYQGYSKQPNAPASTPSTHEQHTANTDLTINNKQDNKREEGAPPFSQDDLPVQLPNAVAVLQKLKTEIHPTLVWAERIENHAKAQSSYQARVKKKGERAVLMALKAEYGERGKRSIAELWPGVEKRLDATKTEDFSKDKYHAGNF